MKKVLIITYHYLPAHIIAARRAKAYADYFHRHSIKPTILAHQYSSDGSISQTKAPISYEDYEHYDIYRIAQAPTKIGNIKRWFWKHSLLRKVYIITAWMREFLDTDPVNEDSYSNFKQFLFHHLETNPYDYVIGIYNPHFALKLAYEVYKKHRIPYILDFRDLWSRQPVSEETSMSIQEKVQTYFIVRNWTKWIRSSYAYAITSREWLDVLENISSKKGCVIPNGYEDDFDQISSEKTAYFSIGYMGTLYPNQDIDTFIEGFNRFLKELGSGAADVKLSLLGLSQNYRKEAIEEIKQRIPPGNLELKDRVNMYEAIKFCKSQWLLWFPAFPDVKGWFSAKVYDYLASGSHILLAPGDLGIVERSIGHLSHVHVSNTPEEVYETLRALFHRWKIDKKSLMVNEVDDQELALFKRSHQAKLMANIVNDSSNKQKTLPSS